MTYLVHADNIISMKQPINVKDLIIPDYIRDRYKIPNEPWKELFTNGIPKSCSFMLTAEPGAGKTTFMLMFAEMFANMNKRALFITTEQSVYDVKLTCERIGVNNIDIVETTDIHDVIKYIPNYQAVILDSFACLEYTDRKIEAKNRDLEKLRKILNTVHDNECVFVMIQHITKNGTYKGSTYLAHMVDVVMHMEITDSVGRMFTVNKNRYGCCKEYEMIMTSRGLVCGEPEITNEPVVRAAKVVHDSPAGLPTGCVKISDLVYKNKSGSYYLITKHGVKYVHQDRMDKLLEKHGTMDQVIHNYRVRVVN